MKLEKEDIKIILEIVDERIKTLEKMKTVCDIMNTMFSSGPDEGDAVIEGYIKALMKFRSFLNVAGDKIAIEDLVEEVCRKS